MLHLGTVALSAFFVLTSAAAPAAAIGGNTQSAPVAYEQTEALNGTWETVEIPYTSKTLTKSYLMSIMYPDYNYSPAVGSCGCIAGTNVLGFFDRYDENLIPDHQSGTMFGNAFLYNMQDSAVEKVADILYEYMGTEHVGTTEDEFLDGMKRYCSEKGKTITFSSCMSWNAFDFQIAQQKMDANQPIVLFLRGYNVSILDAGENSDKIEHWVSDVNHIMVSFGYTVYYYETNRGNVTYDFLNVSTGLTANTRMLCDLHYKVKIEDALAVNIY